VSDAALPKSVLHKLFRLFLFAAVQFWNISVHVIIWLITGTLLMWSVVLELTSSCSGLLRTYIRAPVASTITRFMPHTVVKSPHYVCCVFYVARKRAVLSGN